MSIPVLIPLLNPNEPEARVVSVHVKNLDQVSQGDLICTLETTKSTADILAEASGYIIRLNYRENQIVSAGDLLCYISETPDWLPPADSGPQTRKVEQFISASAQTDSEFNGLRISQPALSLARQHSIDLSQLPTDRFITQTFIQALIEAREEPDKLPLPQYFDPSAILIYGGGGHGKQVVELLAVLGSYKVVGFIDDGISAGTEILDIPVLGGREVLSNLYNSGLRFAVNAVGGIGNLAIRIKVFQALISAGYECPTIIHPTAYVEPSAILDSGVQVFAHAYIGSEAMIGYGCIINTGAIVSHDCRLDDYVNISPGAILAGEVKINSNVLVGMGATINLMVNVGSKARIGNNATVKGDVPENGIVHAGKIWPK